MVLVKRHIIRRYVRRGQSNRRHVRGGSISDFITLATLQAIETGLPIDKILASIGGVAWAGLATGLTALGIKKGVEHYKRRY